MRARIENVRVDWSKIYDLRFTSNWFKRPPPQKLPPDVLLARLRAAKPQSRAEYALAWQWLFQTYPEFRGDAVSSSPSPRVCLAVGEAARQTGMSNWAHGILMAYVNTR